MAGIDVQYNIPDGFPTYGANVISYVNEDQDTLLVNQPIWQIMVTAEADVSNLPDEVPIGSLAFLADESKKWRKAADGDWDEIGAADAPVDADG